MYIPPCQFRKICTTICGTILVVCGGYISNASRFFDLPAKHFLPCPGIAAFFECERNLLTLKINNHSKFSFLKEKNFCILHVPISMLQINTVSEQEASDKRIFVR